MTNHIFDLINCESFSLRIAPGEYRSFPVVDNKGQFVHFRKTDDKFIHMHEFYLSEDGPLVGLYKKVGGFSILVCAFYKLDEINQEAKEIINGNDDLRKCIESTLQI